MHITTTDPQDTDRLMRLVDASQNIQKIKRILSNKHNAKDQIKAIKKVLETAPLTTEVPSDE